MHWAVHKKYIGHCGKIHWALLGNTLGTVGQYIGHCGQYIGQCGAPDDAKDRATIQGVPSSDGLGLHDAA